jgi:pyruvate kinase
VRDAAARIGKQPFVIAKLERSRALDRLPEILEAAAGVMVARGDLGVEIPVERVPVVQKWIVREANLRARPVITATQMLESMTGTNRPTRAEATDVATAVLDGTDAVMLSAESAVGRYPVESVRMLARIAREVEQYRLGGSFREQWRAQKSSEQPTLTNTLALTIETTVERLSPALVMIPTRSGDTARHVTRYRLPAWIVALCTLPDTARHLHFSWGVHPVVVQEPEDWHEFIGRFMDEHGIAGNLAVVVAGPSEKNPNANHRMELVELRR